MKIMKKLILVLIFGGLSPASASATIWDDAKEIIATHKKEIAIGAAVVVAAAVGFGCGVGGKIVYDRYIKKNVAEGTHTIQDVIGSVTSSVQRSASKTNPVAPMVQSTEPQQIAVVSWNCENAKGFDTAFVEKLNSEHSGLKAALFSVENQGKMKSLLMFARAQNRWVENALGAFEPLSQNSLLNNLTPKVLVVVSPDVSEFSPACREVTSEIKEHYPQITNVFSRVFRISDCAKICRSEMQWLPITSPEYKSAEVKNMLDGIAEEFLKK